MLISMQIRKDKHQLFNDASLRFATTPRSVSRKMTLVMTAVHLWLLASSPRAELQYSLQRLPAGEECHTEAGEVCGLINAICICMIKTNPHQGEVLHLRPFLVPSKQSFSY